MTRRVPILATLIVLAAVATMLALGIWQLQRRHEKEALIARYRANAALPAIPFPTGAADAALLFRQTQAFCAGVNGWQTEGAGAAGFRHIARCGGPDGGFAVDVGAAPDPRFRPDWRGGPVRGWIVPERQNRSWLAPSAPLRLMIVSAAPAPGLAAPKRPDPASLPNNHLAYAVQWFLFATSALAIYALALRQRWRKAGNPQ
ncbi:MAG: hypothetical protein A4S16_02095 [Proteobacteria bacterium SG_bin6]|nr:MAG: hypothetical protein A4S16_02095 [Proteobacteria bacterium SG_bin6]